MPLQSNCEVKRLREKCVSVIVPIYNSDEYLDKCIQSIINQSYTNLQIILVNDGSNDNSRDICDRYAMKDSRIEVYHLENRGVSATRNYALECVKGEYIQFVDSDDMLKPKMTEIMVKAMENEQIGMVVCNYIKVFRNTRIRNEILEKSGVYTNKEYLCNTLRDPGHHYYGVVWNKIYRAEIIKRFNMQFDQKTELGEDFIFNLSYWAKSNGVKVLQKYLYYYQKERDITLSQNRHKVLDDCRKELKNRKRIFTHYVSTFQNMGFYRENKDNIYFYCVSFFVRQWHSVKHDYSDWSEKDKDKWKKELLEDSNIRKSMKYVSKKEILLYDRKYMLEYWIKYICKQIGGIV